MTLITDRTAPADVPSTNALADLPAATETETPSAYLTFGSSPGALEDPPEIGEIRTYLVKARCTEEHGPIERKDGEMRYKRTLVILSCWEQGKPKPPDPDEDQPALFGEDGEVPADEDDEDQEGADEDPDEPLDDEACGRPAFSDGAGE